MKEFGPMQNVKGLVRRFFRTTRFVGSLQKLAWRRALSESRSRFFLVLSITLGLGLPMAQASDWGSKSVAMRAAEAYQAGSFWTIGYIASGLIGTVAFMTVLALILIYAERKVAAHFQCRLGPMRVGWHGTLQSVADALKLILKEDIIPTRADRFLHLLAPILAVMAMLLALVAVPLSPILHVVDSQIGVLYVTAVSGIGVLGILLGGWSSNNKWSLLGAMRAGAQVISYELSVTLTLLVAVMLSGSLQLSKIVESQAAGWWVWRAPIVGLVAFVMFVVASTAEINRTPFDIAEGESELTAGFHTEYSGMRFSMFFLAEFLNMFVVSAIGATLFLGGWMPLQIGNWVAFNQVMALVPPVVWFFLKTSFIIFIIMWFRWTFPRLRVDQLMRLEWKFLLPLGLVNLMLAAVMVVMGWYFFAGVK